MQVDMQQLKAGEVNLGVRIDPKSHSQVAHSSDIHRPQSWPYNSKAVLSLVQTRGQLLEATSYAVVIPLTLRKLISIL